MSSNISFKNARLRLTGLYLLIIMVVSLLFSAVIYQLTYQELDRHLDGQRAAIERTMMRRQGPFITVPSYDEIESTEKLLRQEARRRILARLAILNIVVLSSGGLLAYIFADKTLRPIEMAHVAQKRFASDAAHELRTPLAALKLENEVTLRAKNATANDLIDQIKSNIEEVDRLEALATSLMDLTKLEEMKLSFNSCNLVEIVDAAVANIEKAARNKNITLEKDFAMKKAIVSVHSESIGRIINILLDNAVKYSDTHKQITVRLSKKQDIYSVAVIDHGIGIKAEDLPHIFERFYRSETSRTNKGHGLGLALAQELAQANHAKLHVKSTTGEGSTFTLSISSPKRQSDKTI